MESATKNWANPRRKVQIFVLRAFFLVLIAFTQRMIK